MEMSDRMFRLVVKVFSLSGNDYRPPLFSYSVATASQTDLLRRRTLQG